MGVLGTGTGDLLLYCCFTSQSGSWCVPQSARPRVSCLSPTHRQPGEVPAAQVGPWAWPGNDPESYNREKNCQLTSTGFISLFFLDPLNLFDISFIALSLETIISVSFLLKSKMFFYRGGKKRNL